MTIKLDKYISTISEMCGNIYNLLSIFYLTMYSMLFLRVCSLKANEAMVNILKF